MGRRWIGRGGKRKRTGEKRGEGRRREEGEKNEGGGTKRMMTAKNRG